MVYEPQEDSYILKAIVKKYAKGIVLDMGTGAGIQAIEAAKAKQAQKVYAIDLDKKAIEAAKINATSFGKKIKFLRGDLFSPFKTSKYDNYFDLITFNAPYLPQEGAKRHIDLEGGKRGNEIIQRFLEQAGKFLKRDGRILLLFSSLTPNIDKICELNLFEFKEIARQSFFFEDLICWEIKPNKVARDLHKIGVTSPNYFARGKRGYVFVGKYKKQKVAIKIRNPDSTAPGTIEIESKMLRITNKIGVGPKLFANTNDYMIMEFIDGVLLKEALESWSKKRIRVVCKKILDKCFALDKIGVNKQEMVRPLKHVILKGTNVKFVDFERARKKERTHNVSQFCQFIGNRIDQENKTRWVELARKYIESKDELTLNEMKRMLK